MRVTARDSEGNMIINRRVLDIRVMGGVQVQQVMKGGVQIYPDNETRVKSIVVDTTPLDQTEAGIYWMHAEELCRTSSSLTQRMSLELPEDRYNLFSTYGIYPLVDWDRGKITFDKLDAPLESSLRVGDTVTMRLVAPEHDSPVFETASYNESLGPSAGTKYDEIEETVLPWYPKTKLYCTYVKGQKKVDAGTKCSLVAVPSGREHIFYQTMSWGRWRGTPTVWASAENEKVLENAVEYRGNPVINGLDRSALVKTTEIASDKNEVWVKYPAFSKVVKLTILSISTHE